VGGRDRQSGRAAERDLQAVGLHANITGADDLRPYYETVLAAFGPDRLMFGSDWPMFTAVASYDWVCGLYRELTAQLSTEEQDAIFDRTARRVYRLE
jgi:L-fuconolactonase